MINFIDRVRAAISLMLADRFILIKLSDKPETRITGYVAFKCHDRMDDILFLTTKNFYRHEVERAYKDVMTEINAEK